MSIIKSIHVGPVLLLISEMFDNKTTPHSSSSYIEIFKFLVQRPMFSKIQSLLGKAPSSA